MLTNEVNNIENLLETHSTERKQLENLDLSNLLIIKNPNNEVALGKKFINPGYCPNSKLPIDVILNTSETEKNIIHQHYGTIAPPVHRGHEISPRLYSYMKTEILLIKYTILFLSLIILTLDAKNIRFRISQLEEIISEVI
jgi:hypothetical protein